MLGDGHAHRFAASSRHRLRRAPRTAGASATARRSRGSTRRRPRHATSSSSRSATACSSTAARSGDRRRDLRLDRPVHGAAAGRGRQGDGRRHRQGRPGRPPRPAPLVGPAVRPGAGQVPVPHQPHPPGALARVRGPRVDGLGQADQGVARRRRPAGRQPLLVLRRLGRQARLRVPGSGRPAARCRRPDHPVELPAADARLEDRPGPRRRQHGRPQARLDHAAQRAAVRRRLRPGRPAAGHGQHRHRTRRRGHGPRHPSRASTRSRSPARPRSAARSSRAWPAPTRR